jgi:hypothetical protein
MLEKAQTSMLTQHNVCLGQATGTRPDDFEEHGSQTRVGLLAAAGRAWFSLCQPDRPEVDHEVLVRIYA